MAKITKTPSGKWCTRVYLGKTKTGQPRYKRITADTKAECIQKAQDIDKRELMAKVDPLQGPYLPRRATIGDVVDKYIDLCKVLSPTTVDGYEKMRRTAFRHFMDVPIEGLTEQTVQQAVNIESFREGRLGRISAKTLANEWGLISSALWKIARLKFEVRLPKRQPKYKEYPEPAEVLHAVVGTELELPCLLALWLSFSMSEIRGLMWSDIHEDTITINRTLVDVGTLPTIKDTAKTAARKRRHRLPPYLLGLLARTEHTSEFIVPQNHSVIYGRFKRLMHKHNLDITFHDLRHLNASVMLALGIPDRYAMERGGWSSPYVMQRVYQHTFTSQRLAVDSLVDSYFTSLLNGHTPTMISPPENPQTVENSTHTPYYSGFDSPRHYQQREEETHEKG